MTLSEKLAAERKAKKLKITQRQAARKPAPRRQAAMPHHQNRLLLIKDPSRMSAGELLDSQLKVHLYLELLLLEHDEHCVRYFSLLLDSVRCQSLLTDRAQLEALADKAAAELAGGAEVENRRKHFATLTALACAYAAELPQLSKQLLVECDTQAGAVMTLDIVGDMLLLPDWTFPAFDKLCDDKKATLDSIAAHCGVSRYALTRAVLQLAQALYALYCCSSGFDAPKPGSVTAVRRYSAQFSRCMGSLKETAREQTAAIMQFHRLFGVSLIDVDKLTAYGRAA